MIVITGTPESIANLDDSFVSQLSESIRRECEQEVQDELDKLRADRDALFIAFNECELELAQVKGQLANTIHNAAQAKAKYDQAILDAKYWRAKVEETVITSTDDFTIADKQQLETCKQLLDKAKDFALQIVSL